MATEPLKPFKGNLQAHKKCCVIEEGTITQMFWEYSGGKDEFDHERVIERWKELYPEMKGMNDFVQQQFLSKHGFAIGNVIRDGVRPPQS